MEKRNYADLYNGEEKLKNRKFAFIFINYYKKKHKLAFILYHYLHLIYIYI